jgi:UDP-N-acetylglucosamine transferase subunit ALG13
MQLGFDRLIEAMDALTPTLGMEVIAQTGKGGYVPQHMEARAKIEPSEFEALMARADAIVSHAGIGTVLTATRLLKPIVLMPRRAELGEHRNDHQLATVDKLRDRAGIFIADLPADLAPRIAEALRHQPAARAPSPQAATLNRAIAQFVETGRL